MKAKRFSLTVILLFAAAIVLAVGAGYGSARAVCAMVDEEVNIPDQHLENAIRDGLDIHGRAIRAIDMERINRLELSNGIRALGDPTSFWLSS